MGEITVTAYPRVHVGLLDLAGATRRSYGGAGFSFNGPCVRMTIRQSGIVRVLGESLTSQLGPKLRSVMERLQQLTGGAAEVYVHEAIPEHFGLGSTTAAVLAMVKGVSIINGIEWSDEEITSISGRGRTSGVGSRAFFSGGFVIDVGQRGHPADGVFRPSLDPGGRPPSLAVGSWCVPDDWRVLLLLASDPCPLSPEEERDLFAEFRGDRGESLRQMAALYHGLLPSILEADFEMLQWSLHEYQRQGMKQREISVQSNRTQELLARAWRDGLAAGLSSMGPCIFVIHRADDPLDGWCASYAADQRVLGPFRFRNQGAAIGNGRFE